MKTTIAKKAGTVVALDRGEYKFVVPALKKPIGAWHSRPLQSNWPEAVRESSSKVFGTILRAK